jgi:O-phospho-L-seryl-tRNASec:L-selenocysteinyl-tRNA synthase
MDATSIPALFSSLQIPSNHTSVGLSNLVSSNSQVKALFHHKRLPDVGWSDIQIQRLLLEVSVLDTNCEESVKCQLNNEDSSVSLFAHRWTGAGEREGRVYSPLVLQRHFGLGHGIGRSGDVMEAQPKAVGSSALLRLTLKLALDAIRRGAGLNGTVGKGGGAVGGPASFGVLLPVCTGMSMSLVLSGLRDRARKMMDATDTRNNNDNNDIHDSMQERNIVLWSRIDQKSCYKAILSAGLKCIVLPTKARPDTDEVSTDLDALKAALDMYGRKILAVLTTTSCFCPRVPDEVDAVAKMIQTWNEENQTGGGGGAGISHVINHAYGLQCQATNKLLNRACTIGRVDAIVCSTDKNFLVPVGGALIISPNSNVIESISTNYPGRASASPMIDLLITLLSMGLDGYKTVLEERRRLIDNFRRRLEAVANVFGERILVCPRNSVSFGITLDKLIRSNNSIDTQHSTQLSNEDENNQITKFGSMLFTRCISGTRVVARNESKTISGHTFQGFGSSHDTYPHAYMTAACAIGMTKGEMNEFFVRLERCWKDFLVAREKESTKKKKEEGTCDLQKNRG